MPLGTPKFGPSVVHGKKAGWIKMPLGIEVGHGPDHIVLDGDPLPKEVQSPAQIFGPYLLWPNRWINQNVTC